VTAPLPAAARTRVAGTRVAGPCRSCGSITLEPVLDLGDMPLANSVLTGAELARPEPRHPLEVLFCPACALVQIGATVPPEEMFSDYAYFSSYSTTAVERAGALVASLVESQRLGPDSLAVEVASNDGYLLRHYVSRGVPVLGIDPAANVVAAAEAVGVPTLCRFFGPDLAEELRASGLRADVLHANNVLAHVPDVNGFASAIERVLADGGVAVVETPYVRDLVERVEFDTVYHEHVFYYSLTSLTALFERNGLQVVDVERIPIHGGSLRVSLEPGASAGPAAAAVDELLDEERRLGLARYPYYAEFGGRVAELVERLQILLRDLKSSGASIAAYGAAAKGTILLNTLGVGVETLDFVADRNPHKHGLHMPGVHVPIVPPERLAQDMPDFVLLLAWNFADEVLAQQARYRRRGGRFILPVPEPVIV